MMVVKSKHQKATDVLEEIHITKWSACRSEPMWGALFQLHPMT